MPGSTVKSRLGITLLKQTAPNKAFVAPTWSINSRLSQAKNKPGFVDFTLGLPSNGK